MLFRSRCRNISDSGARLDVGMDIQLNDMVDIAFSDETVVSARVVWTNGNDCGVAFAREVDSAALLSRPSADAPQRATRSPRLHADFLARVWNGYATIKSRVSNISQRGMRLSHDGSFHEGLHVKILLPGGRERAAVVRWSKDDIAGVYLLEPFSAVELGSITGLSGS